MYTTYQDKRKFRPTVVFWLSLEIKRLAPYMGLKQADLN